MSIVKKYKAKVESIVNPLPDIYTVTFSSEKRFQYLPGQFLHLALDPYDGIGQWPESRCFSMQSSPDEELIKITFAVKGNYTNRMKCELHKGKEIWLKLPYGDIFQRGHDKINCVFIAGGTGVTPFLSLFTHASFNEYVNPRIYLGFRSEEYNIYNEELNRMYSFREIRNNSCNSLTNNGIRNNSCNLLDFVKFVYEDIDGILDIEKIYCENPDAVYFISGPPIMIKTFRKYLLDKQVPVDKIITDDWE